MNKSSEEIFEHTQKVMQELFELDDALLTPEAKLYEDLDIDSVDAVELLIELKQFTGTEVNPNHFKEVKTLQDIVDVVSAI